MALESKLIGSINHFRTDSSGWIGSVVMLAFALVAGYRWHATGLIFFGLLVLRDLAASWFLISRNSSVDKSGSKLITTLSYVSSAWPFIYLSPLNSLSHAGIISSVLAILGFTISTLAIFDLGSSFGVSPANRGLVTNGLYRYARHPMYTGYVIAEFGFVLLNPINLIIWVISVGFYFARTKIEERVLSN